MTSPGTSGSRFSDEAMMASDRDPKLRTIDDDTLLEMYEQARADEDEACDAIAAELIWRGIAVQPCGHSAGLG